MNEQDRRVDRVQDALGGIGEPMVDPASKCRLYRCMKVLEELMIERGDHQAPPESEVYYRLTSARANRYSVLQQGGDPVVDWDRALDLVDDLENAIRGDDKEGVRKVIGWRR